MSLTGFAARKAIAAVITIFAILCVNFLIFRIAPGDPVRMMFKDPRVSAQALELQRQKFGIDKPLSGQFVAYIAQLSRGELGISFWQKRPVTEVIAERIPATLALVLTALVIAVLLGVALGAIAGWRNGTKLDTFLLTASLKITPCAMPCCRR